MKIGMLLPSLLMSKRFEERIFAPKPLFLSLIEGLVKKGHQVFVYTSSNVKTTGILIEGSKILEQKDLSSVKFRQDDKEASPWIFYKLTETEYELDLTIKAFIHAKDNKIDIIHSYHGHMAHYISKLVSEIPVVYTLHDPVFSPQIIEGFRIDHFSNDNYIAISQNQANNYQAWVKKINIVDVVHHGVDISAFPFSKKEGNYLAFIGRLIPSKGIEEAISVAGRLSLPLEIATSSNYFESSYYQETVKPLLESKLVRVTEYLQKKERDIWLKEAKALLFPISWEEPFGMVMIESMACGTPVIAYARGSVPEVVMDGVTGFVIKDQRSKIKDQKWIIKKEGVEGLVEAVKRINSMSSQEYGKMRLACRKHVEENFTVERMVEGYERVYQRLVTSV